MLLRKEQLLLSTRTEAISLASFLINPTPSSIDMVSLRRKVYYSLFLPTTLLTSVLA